MERPPGDIWPRSSIHPPTLGQPYTSMTHPRAAIHKHVAVLGNDSMDIAVESQVGHLGVSLVGSHHELDTILLKSLASEGVGGISISLLHSKQLCED